MNFRHCALLDAVLLRNLALAMLACHAELSDCSNLVSRELGAVVFFTLLRAKAISSLLIFGVFGVIAQAQMAGVHTSWVVATVKNVAIKWVNASGEKVRNTMGVESTVPSGKSSVAGDSNWPKPIPTRSVRWFVGIGPEQLAAQLVEVRQWLHVFSISISRYRVKHQAIAAALKLARELTE